MKEAVAREAVVLWLCSGFELKLFQNASRICQSADFMGFRVKFVVALKIDNLERLEIVAVLLSVIALELPRTPAVAPWDAMAYLEGSFWT